MKRYIGWICFTTANTSMSKAFNQSVAIVKS